MIYIFNNLISLILFSFCIRLNFKYGWTAMHLEEESILKNKINELGIRGPGTPIMGTLSFLGGIFLLTPKTFLVGILINSIIISILIQESVKSKKIKLFLCEILFFLIILIMLFLGFPFLKMFENG